MVQVVAGSGLGLLNTLSQNFLQSSNQSQANNQVYVNSASGNLILSRQDLLLVGAGLDMQTTRTYNSLGQFDDDNGDNFRFNYHRYLKAFTLGEKVTLVMQDGHEAEFIWDDNSQKYHFVNAYGSDNQLEVHLNDDNQITHWVLTEGATQHQDIYEEVGGVFRLRYSVDSEGNRLRYDYNQNHLIATITDETNLQTTTLRYDSHNNVLSIQHTLEDGEQTRIYYQYEEYAGGQRLSQLIVDLSPEDNTIVESDGVTLQASTYVTTYQYRDDSSVLVSSITESDGRVVSFSYDQLDRIQRVTLGTGEEQQITEYEYGENYTDIRSISSETDAIAHRLYFDEQQRITQVDLPENAQGQAVSYYYKYNDHNQLITITEADGISHHYQYDEQGNRILEQNGQGNTVTYAYDERNRLVTYTVYQENDSELEDSPYLEDGTLNTAFNDAKEPLSTHYFYDAFDRLRFVIHADGSVIETRYTGSSVNRVEQEIIYTDTINRYLPGESNDLMAITALRDLTATEQLDVLTAWSSSLNLEKAQVTETYRDERGQVREVRSYAEASSIGEGSGDANRRWFIYDQYGQLLKQVDARAADENSATYAVYYTYDSLGRLTSTTDPKNQITRFQYQDASSTIVTERADGLLHTAVYGTHGLLLSQTETSTTSTSIASHYHYDERGLLRATAQTGAETQFFWYDDWGQVIATLDSQNRITEMVYDINQRVVATIYYAEQASDTLRQTLQTALQDNTLNTLDNVIWQSLKSERDRYERSVYDDSGQIIQTLDGDGYLTEYEYNSLAQLQQVKQYSEAATFEVDAIGKVNLIEKGSDPAQDRVTQYVYTDTGQIAKTIKPNGLTTEFYYDAAGREIARFYRGEQDLTASYQLYNGQGQLITQIDQAGYRIDYRYDAVGNRTQQMYYANAVSDATLALLASLSTQGRTLLASELIMKSDLPSGDNQVYQYAYNALNQLVSEQAPTGLINEYLYDLMGRLVETHAHGSGETRATQRIYDAFGRMTHELTATAIEHNNTMGLDPTADQAIAIRHDYDDAGRRIKTIDELGQTHYYYYNAQGLLQYAINSDAQVIQYNYNGFAELSKVTRYAQKLTVEDLSLTGGQVDQALQTQITELAFGDYQALNAVNTVDYDQRGFVKRTVDAANAVTLREVNAFGEVVGIQQQVSADTGLSSHWLRSEFGYDQAGQLTTLRQGDSHDLMLRQTRLYDEFGRLLTSQDANANLTHYAYADFDRQVVIEDAAGYQQQSHVDAFGRLSQTITENGTITHYDYLQGEASGDNQDSFLQANADPILANLHTATSRLTSTITSATGETMTSVQYLNVFGEQTLVIDSEGNYSVFFYDAGGQLLEHRRYASDHILLTVETNRYALNGLLTEHIDAAGTQTQYRYDAVSRLAQTILDPSDPSTSYQGLDLAYQYDFDHQFRQLTTVDPSGVKTQTYYDVMGRVSMVVKDPEGLATAQQFLYDGVGRLIEQHQGTVTLNEYDELSFTALHTLQYAYDALNRKVSETENPGSEARMRYYTYDNNDNVMTVTDAAGYTTRYFYSSRNERRFTIDAKGYLLEYRYDARGNLTQQYQYASPVSELNELSLGNLEQWITSRDVIAQSYSVYDGFDRLTYSIDAKGFVQAFSYNSYGQLTQSILYQQAIDWPLNTDDEITPDAIAAALSTAEAAVSGSQTQVYDSLGRIVYAIDAQGFITAYEYNAMGKVIAETRYDNDFTDEISAWRADNNQTAQLTAATIANIVDANFDLAIASDSRWFYDRAGQVRFAINAIGVVTEYRYDERGNLREQLVYTQDEDRVTSDRSALNLDSLALEYASKSSQVEYRVYNTLNELRFSIDEAGYVIEYDYDKLGNRILEYRYSSSDTVFERLTADNLTVSDLSETWLMQTYALDDKKSQYWIYDERQQVRFGIDFSGGVSAYTYDERGYRVRTDQFVAVADRFDGSEDQLNLEWFEANYSDQSADSEHFFYDERGLLVLQINAQGQLTRYHYDSSGKLARQEVYADALPSWLPHQMDSIQQFLEGTIDEASYSELTENLASALEKIAALDLSQQIDIEPISNVPDGDGSDVELDPSLIVDDSLIENAPLYDAFNQLKQVIMAQAKVQAQVAATNISASLSQAELQALNFALSNQVDIGLQAILSSTEVASIDFGSAELGQLDIIDPNTFLQVKTDGYLGAEDQDLLSYLTGLYTLGAQRMINQFDELVVDGEWVMMHHPLPEPIYPFPEEFQQSHLLSEFIILSHMRINELSAANDPNLPQYMEFMQQLGQIIDGTGVLVLGILFNSFDWYMHVDTQQNALVLRLHRMDASPSVESLGFNLALTELDAQALVDAQRDQLQPNTAQAMASYQFYNALEQLEYQINWQGQVTRYEYDEWGRVTSEQVSKALYPADSALDALTGDDLSAFFGEQQALTSGIRVTQYAYNQRSQVTHLVNSENQVTEYQYNSLGQRVLERLYVETLAEGETLNTFLERTQNDPEAFSQTIFYYDEQNNLIYKADPLGYVTEYRYDAFNRLTLQKQLKHVWSASIERTEVPDSQALSAFLNDPDTQLQGYALQTHYYNERGQIAYQVSAIGQVSQYQYDAFGNIVIERHFDDLLQGSLENFIALLAANQYQAEPSPPSRTVYRAYDDNNQLRFEKDILGRVTAYERNAAGQIIRQVVYSDFLNAIADSVFLTDPNAYFNNLNAPIDYLDYYYQNRLLTHAVNQQGQITVYEYSAAGAITAQRVANTTLERVINDNGLLERATLNTVKRTVNRNQAGLSNEYIYDQGQRLRFEIDATGRIIEYQYDTFDQVIAKYEFSKALPSWLQRDETSIKAFLTGENLEVLREQIDAYIEAAQQAIVNFQPGVGLECAEKFQRAVSSPTPWQTDSIAAFEQSLDTLAAERASEAITQLSTLLGADYDWLFSVLIPEQGLGIDLTTKELDSIAYEGMLALMIRRMGSGDDASDPVSSDMFFDYKVIDRDLQRYDVSFTAAPLPDDTLASYINRAYAQGAELLKTHYQSLYQSQDFEQVEAVVYPVMLEPTINDALNALYNVIPSDSVDDTINEAYQVLQDALANGSSDTTTAVALADFMFGLNTHASSWRSDVLLIQAVVALKLAIQGEVSVANDADLSDELMALLIDFRESFQATNPEPNYESWPFLGFALDKVMTKLGPLNDMVLTLDKAMYQLSINGSFALPDGLVELGTVEWDVNFTLTDSLNDAVFARIIDSPSRTAEYQYYDDLGQLRYQINHSGLLVAYDYDTAGNLIREINYGENIGLTIDISERPAVDTIEAFIASQSTASTDESSSTSQQQLHFYNEHQQLAFTVTSHGQIQAFEYDYQGHLQHHFTLLEPAVGDLTLLTLADLTNQLSVAQAMGSSAYTLVSTYYDEIGQLRFRLEDRQLSEFSYNGLGELITEQTYAIALTQSEMLTANSISALEALAQAQADDQFIDKSLTKVLDERGLVSFETDQLGRVTHYKYNINGQVIAKYRAALMFNGDANDQVALAAFFASLAVDDLTQAHWIYDDIGQLRFEISSAGLVTEYRYNVLGQNTEITRYNGFADRYMFDTPISDNVSLEALSSLYATKTGSVSQQVFDTAGNLRVEAYDHKHYFIYSYDARDRLIATASFETDDELELPSLNTLEQWIVEQELTQDIARQVMVLDDSGQMQWLLNSDGFITQYEYDVRGQLISTQVFTEAYRSEVTLPAHLLQHVLDINHITLNDTESTASYVQNTMHEYLANEITAFATNQASSTLFSSHQVFDAHSRLRFAVNAEGFVEEWLYDLNGNVIAHRQYEQIYTDEISYQQLSQFAAAQGSSEMISEYWVYNEFDQARFYIDALGQITEYQYDNFGYLRATLNYTDTALRYVSEHISDYRLNVLTAHVSGAKSIANTTYYDSAGQLQLQVDALGHGTFYQYDARGFLTAQFQSLTALDSLPAREEEIDQWLLTLAESQSFSVERFVNDTAGQVILQRDAEGYLTEYAYTGAGELMQTKVFHQPLVDNDNIALLAALKVELGYGDPLTAAQASTLLSAWNEAIEDSLHAYASDANQGVDSAYVFTDYDTNHRYQIDSTGQLQRETLNANGLVILVEDYPDRVITHSDVQAIQVDVGAWADDHLAGVTAVITKRMVFDANNHIRYAIDSDTLIEYQYDHQGNVTQEARYVLNDVIDAYIADLLAAAERDDAPDTEAQDWPFDDKAAMALLLYQTLESELYQLVEYSLLARLGLTDTAASTHRVFNGLNQLTFEINAIGALAHWQYDARGNIVAESRYVNLFSGDNHDAAMLQAFVDAAEPADVSTEYYAYDENDQLRYSIDALGYIKAYTYDGLGQRTQTTYYKHDVARYLPVEGELEDYALANVTTFINTTYSAFINNHPDSLLSDFAFSEYQYLDRIGRVRLAVDGDGFGVIYGYDALGNRTSALQLASAITDLPDPLMTDDVDRFIANLAQAALNSGDYRLSLYLHDSAGRLVASSDVSGTITKFEPNYRDVTAKQAILADAFQVSWLDEWTTSGAIVDAALAKSLMTAQQQHWLNALSHQVETATAVDFSEQVLIDHDNKVEYHINPLGFVTEKKHNQYGQIDYLIEYGLAVTQEQLSQTDFNLADYLRSQVSAAIAAQRALPQITRYFYDSEQRLQYEVNAAGYMTEYEYDGLDRLMSQYQYEEPIADDYAIATASLLAQGERNFIGDPKAFTTVLPSGGEPRQFDFYDFVFSWSGSEVPLGTDISKSSFFWHEWYSTEIDEGYLTIEYDGQGNYFVDTADLERFHDQLEFIIEYKNSNGRTLAEVVIRLDHDTRYNRHTSDSYSALPTSRQTHYLYDSAGQERYRIDGENYVIEKRYDGLGRVVEEIQWSDKAYVYTETMLRDTLGEVDHATGSQDEDFDRTVQYQYDALGQVTTIAKSGQQITNMQYDYAGQQIETVTIANNPVDATASNKTWRYDYDHRGNRVAEHSPEVVLSQTDQDGTVATHVSQSVTTVYEYDAFSNRIASHEAFGLVDAQGHSQTRTIIFEYNTRNELIATRYPSLQLESQSDSLVADLSIKNTFDKYGNAIYQQTILDDYQYRFYSANNRLLFEVDEAGYITAFDYDGFNNLIAVTRFAQSYYQWSGFNESMPAHGEARHLWLAGQLPSLTADASVDQQTTMVFDELNREIWRYHPKTHYVLVNDDAFARENNSVALSSSYGQKAVESQYNAFGETIAIIERGYDEAGNEIAQRHSGFAYNQRGERVQQSDAAGQLTVMEYDAAGNQTRVTGPNSDVISTYNVLNQKIKQQTWRDEIASVSDDNSKLVVATEEGYTSDSFAYDELGRLVAYTDALGATQQFRYDGLGRLVQAIAPEKALSADAGANTSISTVAYYYDALGNQVMEERHANDGITAMQTIRKGFNALGYLLWERDAEGNVFYFDWDAAGRVVKEAYDRKLADGGTKATEVSYAYNALGLLASTTQHYQGNEGEAQAVTEQYYNSLGKVTRIAVNGIDTQTFEYDASGSLWRSNADAGIQKMYGYNLFGELVLSVSPQANAAVTIHSSVLDIANALDVSSIINNDAALANYNFVVHTYDSLGRKTKTRDQDFSDVNWSNDNTETSVITITEWEYDDLNHQVTMIGPRGETTVTNYDNLGQIQSQGINGEEIHYFYDAAGYQVGMRNALGNTQAKLTNAAGEVLIEENEAGNRIYREFDGFGRERVTLSGLYVADPSQGWRVDKTYSANNLLISSRKGTQVVSYVYDAIGQRIRETRGLGDESVTTSYDYDDRGQLIRSTTPLGYSTSYAHDAHGNKVLEILSGGSASINQSWHYGADAYRGLLASYSDVDGSVTMYQYDELGQLRREVKTHNDVTLTSKSYGYDNKGQRTSIQSTEHALDETATTYYRYDASGNRIAEYYQKAGTVYQDADITFDLHNRIDTITDTTAGINIDYNYDALGNISWQSIQGSATNFSYDEASRQTLVDGKRITYNADGQQATVTYQDGYYTVRESYYYDANGQLSQMWRNGVLIDKREYDTLGRVVKHWNNAHEYTTYAYDENSRVIGEQQYVKASVGNDILVSSSGNYVYDVHGNLLSKVVEKQAMDADDKAAYFMGELDDAITQIGAGDSVYVHDDRVVVLGENKNLRLRDGNINIGDVFSKDIFQVAMNQEATYVLTEEGKVLRKSHHDGVLEPWEQVASGAQAFSVDDNGVSIKTESGWLWRGTSWERLAFTWIYNTNATYPPLDEAPRVDISQAKKMSVFSQFGEGTHAAAVVDNRLILESVNLDSSVIFDQAIVPDEIAEIQELTITEDTVYILSNGKLYGLDYWTDSWWGTGLDKEFLTDDAFTLLADNVQSFDDNGEQLAILTRDGRLTVDGILQHSGYVSQFQQTADRLAVLVEGELMVQKANGQWESVASQVSHFQLSANGDGLNDGSGEFEQEPSVAYDSLVWLQNRSSGDVTVATTSNTYNANNTLEKAAYTSQKTDFDLQLSTFDYTYDAFGNILSRREHLGESGSYFVENQQSYYITNSEGKILRRYDGSDFDNPNETAQFYYVGEQQVASSTIVHAGTVAEKTLDELLDLNPSSSWDTQQSAIDAFFADLTEDILLYIRGLSGSAYQALKSQLGQVDVKLTGEVAGGKSIIPATYYQSANDLSFTYDGFSSIEDFYASVMIQAARTAKQLFVNADSTSAPNGEWLRAVFSIPEITIAEATTHHQNNYSSVSEQGVQGGQYVVAHGDTLAVIAQKIYGDSRLWYVIADANGLSSNGSLTPGQILQYPSVVNAHYHSDSTFQPYDVRTAMGDVSPSFVSDIPSLGNVAPNSHNQCEAIGKMIAIIVVAIVATLVVTVLTAGIGTAFAGAGFAAGASAVIGSGAVTATTVAAVGTGLIVGGIAGSIASQALAVELGVQEEISWAQVGIDAAANLVGFGVFKVLEEVGSAASQIIGISQQLKKLNTFRNSLNSARQYSAKLAKTAASSDEIASASARVSRAQNLYRATYSSRQGLSGRAAQVLHASDYLLSQGSKTAAYSLKAAGTIGTFAGYQVAALPLALGSAAALAAVDDNAPFDLEQAIYYSLLVGSGAALPSMGLSAAALRASTTVDNVVGRLGANNYVLRLGDDEVSRINANNLLNQRNYRSIDVNNLSQLGRYDRLKVVGHGNNDGIAHLSPLQLANTLQAGGLQQADRISLVACGACLADNYGARLGNRLAHHGIELGSITQRTGKVAVDPRGRKYVQGADQTVAIHHGAGSKVIFTPDKLGQWHDSPVQAYRGRGNALPTRRMEELHWLINGDEGGADAQPAQRRRARANLTRIGQFIRNLIPGLRRDRNEQMNGVGGVDQHEREVRAIFIEHGEPEGAEFYSTLLRERQDLENNIDRYTLEEVENTFARLEQEYNELAFNDDNNFFELDAYLAEEFAGLRTLTVTRRFLNRMDERPNVGTEPRTHIEVLRGLVADTLRDAGINENDIERLIPEITIVRGAGQAEMSSNPDGTINISPEFAETLHGDNALAFGLIHEIGHMVRGNMTEEGIEPDGIQNFILSDTEIANLLERIDIGDADANAFQNRLDEIREYIDYTTNRQDELEAIQTDPGSVENGAAILDRINRARNHLEEYRADAFATRVLHRLNGADLFNENSGHYVQPDTQDVFGLNINAILDEDHTAAYAAVNSPGGNTHPNREYRIGLIRYQREQLNNPYPWTLQGWYNYFRDWYYNNNN